VAAAVQPGLLASPVHGALMLTFVREMCFRQELWLTDVVDEGLDSLVRCTCDCCFWCCHVPTLLVGTASQP
jgi:hypothetical protein